MESAVTVIEIPICECGCTPDAWVHDDRNDDAHPFKRIKPAEPNGVYTVTVKGGAGKPWAVLR